MTDGYDVNMQDMMIDYSTQKHLSKYRPSIPILLAHTDTMKRKMM
jgi:hypothetical protein